MPSAYSYLLATRNRPLSSVGFSVASSQVFTRALKHHANLDTSDPWPFSVSDATVVPLVAAVGKTCIHGTRGARRKEL